MKTMTLSLSSRSLVFLAVSVVVVVGVAGAQFFLAQSNGVLGSTTPEVTCNHSLSSAESPNHATVYRISSSYAVLCLNYTRGSQGKTFFIFSLQAWVQNGSQVESANRPCPIVQGEYRCPGFTVVPSVESAVFENSMQEIALAYTIRALPNASGLYIFFLTPGNPIYLSFGQAPTTVYFTAWTNGPRLPTGVLPTSYNVIGETNVDITLVPWA